MKALRKMGMDAVPALLSELRDEERLSRSISHPTGDITRVNISSTTELAIEILNEIGALDFRTLMAGRGEHISGPDFANVVEDWYQAVQSRGEEAWLVDKVRGGQNAASVCAPRLLAKFPDSYVAAALSGFLVALNSKDHAVCEELLASLAPHRKPAVETVVLEQWSQLDWENNPRERFLLSYFLRRWGHTEVDAAVRANWEKLVEHGFPEYPRRDFPPPGRFRDALGADLTADTLRYLGLSDSPENLRAVLASWPRLPVSLRYPLIEAIWWNNRGGPFEGEPPKSDVFRAFSQELLLSALEDETELSGLQLGDEMGPLNWPRLCDPAAAALHALRPDKYLFDAHAPLPVRERQRLAILNARLREDGLAEKPLPPLPAVVSAVKRNQVVAVEWEEGAVVPDAELRRQLETWRDHPFKADALVSLMTGYTKQPQPGTNRLRIAVRRDGNGTGIIVRARLEKGDPAENQAATGKQLVAANAGLLLSLVNDGSRSDWKEKGAWTALASQTATAFGLAPEIPAAVEAEICLLGR
jgi:hypothetical protein